MTKLIRVYRPGRNNNSFGVVADGIEEAASEHHLYAGRCDYSIPDDDQYEGANAPVGLVCGDPGALGLCEFYGHKERVLVLAANSSHIPQPVLDSIRIRGCTRIWTPSGWSATQIRNAMRGEGPPVEVVPHGISRVYSPVENTEWLKQTPMFSSLRRVGVSLVHLAESSQERKGTVELIRAFEPWVASPSIHLTLVMAPLQAENIRTVIEDLYGNAANIRVMQRWNMTPANMRLAYQCFDAVVQPSRAEGFGLVPLEALACGVPVLVTRSTGHLQWLKHSHNFFGVVQVPVGELEPTRYDDGGLAPFVDHLQIRSALGHLIENIDLWKTQARANAKDILDAWNWNCVLESHFENLRKAVTGES